MSTGFSNYHSVLASALKRRADDYFRIWRADRGSISRYEIIAGERMVLTLLVATYLEALGNLLLALNLDTATIKKIKSESLLEKWTLLPKRFIHGYSLADDEILASLKGLIIRRNAIVHMQPEVSMDGKKVHKGNPFETSGDDHEVILRWLTLPIRLADHIRAHSEEIGFRFRFASQVDQLKGIGQLNP
jgi:hypothetical protein